jgi:Homeodomain-like domain
MRFSSLLDRQERGEITQEEAAEMLGVDVRTFQRWAARYEDGIDAGVGEGRRLRQNATGLTALRSQISDIENSSSGDSPLNSWRFARNVRYPSPLRQLLGKRSKTRGIGMIIRFPRRHESDSLRACRRPTILTACRPPN